MIAKKRIKKLLSLAKDSPYSKRYVSLARKISTKTRQRIPKDEKFRICKFCSTKLTVNNSSVRIDGQISIKCKECGNTRKVPIK
ncbi:MAG: ribonuclease P [Candidatus Altiarchaeota archaeon]|nr:ribonuclease P [Candidatus Altiarchaeota archaeon]